MNKPLLNLVLLPIIFMLINQAEFPVSQTWLQPLGGLRRIRNCFSELRQCYSVTEGHTERISEPETWLPRPKNTHHIQTQLKSFCDWIIEYIHIANYERARRKLSHRNSQHPFKCLTVTSFLGLVTYKGLDTEIGFSHKNGGHQTTV